MTNGEAMKQLGLTDEDLAVFVMFDPMYAVNRFMVELKLKNGKSLNVLNTAVDMGMFYLNHHNQDWMFTNENVTTMLKEYWKKKDICPALQPLLIGEGK